MRAGVGCFMELDAVRPRLSRSTMPRPGSRVAAAPARAEYNRDWTTAAVGPPVQTRPQQRRKATRARAAAAHTAGPRRDGGHVAKSAAATSASYGAKNQKKKFSTSQLRWPF